MRKIVALIFVLFWAFTSSGQNFSLRNKINHQVRIIDSLGEKKASFKAGKTNYQYITNQGQLKKVTRNYSNGRDAIKQEFYLQNDSLLFSTETIISRFGTDGIGWSGGYYFEGGKLKDYETLGHGKSEEGNWLPEKEVLQNFSKAKAEVKAYIKKSDR